MYLCSCEVLINAVASEQSEKIITEMYETHRLSFFQSLNIVAMSQFSFICHLH